MVEEGEFLMSKYKKNMIWSVVLMVMTIVLTVHQAKSAVYRIEYLAEDAALFITAVFYFCINLKNERKIKRNL
ncbi:MAG: hypothetical protein ABSG48_00355 [Geobacteraceae bacterium]|jgi:hypothetical protein